MIRKAIKREINKIIEVVTYERTGKVVHRELDKFGAPINITVVKEGKS